MTGRISDRKQVEDLTRNIESNVPPREQRGLPKDLDIAPAGEGGSGRRKARKPAED